MGHGKRGRARQGGDIVIGITSLDEVACDHCGQPTLRLDKANDLLIAAAPDLLAACKYIADIAVSWQPLTPGDISDVHRAIAKAEGR